VTREEDIGGTLMLATPTLVGKLSTTVGFAPNVCNMLLDEHFLSVVINDDAPEVNCSVKVLDSL